MAVLDDPTHSSPSSRIVDDVGEFVPFARKHLVQGNGIDENREITLAELWPEPDWSDLIAQGRSLQTAASLAVLYESLRISPHPDGFFKLSAAEWTEAYIEAIGHIKALFDTTQYADDAQPKRMRDRFLDRTGLRGAALTRDVARCRVYWAAGRGAGRRVQPPFSMTPRLAELMRWLPKMGWPADTSLLKTPIVPVEFKGGTWRVCLVKGYHYHVVNNESYPCEEDALEVARRELHRKTSADAVPRRRQCADAELVREGPQWRQEGRVITPEHLIEHFGLRALQFGASMGDTERQRWVHLAWDALHDFARILGVPPRWIGLGGLAIAFGARGRSGKPAHYELNLDVTNLARDRGAGSFAHEWGHALDTRIWYWLAGAVGLRRPLFASQFHSQGLAHVFEQAGVPPWGAKAQRALAGISEFWEGRNCPAGEARSEYLSAAIRIRSGHRAGSYWTEWEELFARAFEAFVQDELTDAGIASPWLVYGTREEDYPPEVLGHPYPLGTERELLNAYFRDLIDALKAGTSERMPVYRKDPECQNLTTTASVH